MEGTDFSTWLHDETFKVAVNQLYSQNMAWWWWVADIAANIGIGALALIGVASAAGKPKPLGKLGFPLAILSVFFAWVLLVIPTGRTQNDYQRDYQAWTDLHQSLEALKSEYAETDKKLPLPEKFVERKREIIARDNAIELNESVSWPSLLVKCTEDRTEQEYGKGIRTPEDVKKYLEEHRASHDRAQVDRARDTTVQ